MDSKLTYNSTDYEDEGSESVVIVAINETRDDYYTRYNFKCKLKLIAASTQDIQIEGTYNGFGMEISLNGVRVGEESANVKGTAKGYIVGEIKNKITIQLAFGDGNIGSVTINGTNMTLPEGTQDRVEFEVDPASKYTIVVTKSQNTSNVPKTIIWDSDKTNNPNIKDNELLKNGTIEIGGKEIDSGSVVLSVNDVTLSKEQISNFEEKASGYEISSYLDIKLDQILYKGTKDDVWTNKLDELNNEATITLQLESGVNGNEVVIVHEKHDGTYEIIPTNYNPETNTITFKTSSFSNYAIASKTVAVNTDTDTISTNPQTGDNIIIFSIIFVIALTGILATCIISKKKTRV